MKIAVAMSGGVDSSVTAALLHQEKSTDIFGIFMKNWSEQAEEDMGNCTWINDRRDALAVAAHLHMPLKTVDFEKEYRDQVLEYFYREYAAGRTPNPDILCNKLIKFDALLKYAENLGAEKIATGHYARVSKLKDGRFHLLKGKDNSKDQSYFLCQLTQGQLSKTLFPLGELTKTEVRKLAQKFNLPTADKKDSQGICFIGKVQLQDFLHVRLAAKPGDVINTTGTIIGSHTGAYAYTIGQRHGFRIDKKTPESKPWFVVRTDVTDNTVTVAEGEDNPALFHDELHASHFHWIVEQPNFPCKCSAKIRYRQLDQDCTIFADGHIEFAKPQRAITPGQSIVFYQSDECLGSATIENSSAEF